MSCFLSAGGSAAEFPWDIVSTARAVSAQRTHNRRFMDFSFSSSDGWWTYPEGKTVSGRSRRPVSGHRALALRSVSAPGERSLELVADQSLERPGVVRGDQAAVEEDRRRAGDLQPSAELDVGGHARDRGGRGPIRGEPGGIEMHAPRRVRNHV